MNKEDWKDTTSNEQYRESIKRFVDGIENNHSLMCIYYFTKGIFDKRDVANEIQKNDY